MNEKRTATRVHLDYPVSLKIEDDTVSALLVDLSATGALFAFDDDARAEVDPGVLGLDGSFTIKPKGKPTRLYTGELVRFFVRDGAPHVAIRFWKKYTELTD